MEITFEFSVKDLEKCFFWKVFHLYNIYLKQFVGAPYTKINYLPDNCLIKRNIFIVLVLAFYKNEPPISQKKPNIPDFPNFLDFCSTSGKSEKTGVDFYKEGLKWIQNANQINKTGPISKLNRLLSASLFLQWLNCRVIAS